MNAMIRQLLIVIAVFAGLGIPAAAADAASDCLLKAIARFDMGITDEGLIAIPVSLNTRPFRMLVDTGDYYSVISESAAKSLGLKPDHAGNFSLIGWRGSVINEFVDLEHFGFGPISRGNTQLMVSKEEMNSFDGLVGVDFLYYFDLDFDFAKAKLNLISPNHCPGNVVYWSKGEFGVVPFDFDFYHREIRLVVSLDGKSVGAMIDTGSNQTVMSLEYAKYLFESKARGVKIDEKTKLKALSFGSVTVENPNIDLVPDSQSVLLERPDVKMIIGLDVMRRLHAYIAFQEHKIYVTPATQY